MCGQPCGAFYTRLPRLATHGCGVGAYCKLLALAASESVADALNTCVLKSWSSSVLKQVTVHHLGEAEDAAFAYGIHEAHDPSKRDSQLLRELFGQGSVYKTSTKARIMAGAITTGDCVYAKAQSCLKHPPSHAWTAHCMHRFGS